VTHSKVAFKVPGKDLITEAIAYDPKTNAFFVSAVHKRKILRVANGVAKDFVTANINGVNGLGVDTKRRILYATSMSYERVENFDKDAKGELVAFDVDSGALKARYEAPADAFLDDLTVAPDGTVYVSDSKGSVLRLHDGRLTRFATGMRSAQGSAFGNGLLYVADYGGAIWAVDPRTGDAARLQLPDDFTAVGIDGLELAGNSLFAIQNGVTPNRVVRLDVEGMRITRWEIFEMNHPDFDEPTIGAIARGGFYFIANSQGETISKGKPSREAVVLRSGIRLP
jgi:sugar lactone lactonase YvrE